MSRKGLLVEKRIPLSHLIERFQTLGSALAVSRETRISYKTIRKYLKQGGVLLEPGSPPKSAKARMHSGALMEWIHSHQDVSLPRSVRKISDLTGCSVSAVKSYLYRRRKEIRDFITSLPDLKVNAYKFREAFGRVVTSYHFKRYQVSYDPWNLRIHLEGFLKPRGEKVVSFDLTFQEFQAIIGGVK